MNALQKVIMGLRAHSPFERDRDSIEQSRKDTASVRRRDRSLLSSRGRALPYTGYPLPQAGDSLAARLERTGQNKVIFWWIIFLVLLAFIFGDYLPVGSNKLLFIAVGAIFMLALWQTYIWLPEIRKMRQGAHAERLVAEYLNNDFRDEIEGIVRIYHDIPCGVGNYDHVIYCRKGVFLINTKAMTISVEGINILQYKDNKLYFKSSGIPLKYNPVPKMKDEVARFRRLLEETGYEKPYVFGVVLFPGWEVEEDNPNSSVWVVTPKKMPERINKEDNRLTDAQVVNYANKLSKWTRNVVNYN